MQRKITIVLSAFMVVFGLVAALLGYVFAALVLLFFCYKKWRLRAVLTIVAAAFILIASIIMYLRLGDTPYTVVIFLVGIVLFIVGQYPWKDSHPKV